MDRIKGSHIHKDKILLSKPLTVKIKVFIYFYFLFSLGGYQSTRVMNLYRNNKKGKKEDYRKGGIPKKCVNISQKC